MIVVQELGLILNSLGCASEALEDSADISSHLHRNDAEFIFLIDPNEESLVRIVEDSTAFGPVSVQTASIKESISLLEEEVISNKLLLRGLIHTIKRVECASKVTSEVIASCNDMLHDLVALIICDTRAKREVRKVPANTDPGRLDHGCFFIGEGRAFELGGIHVGDMLIVGTVTMVVLNDLIEELIEGEVGVVGASIHANSRVEVLASREDTSLEGNTSRIALILVFVPDFLGKVLA